MLPLHEWLDANLAQPQDHAARAALFADPNLVARVTHLLEHRQLSRADLCAVAARVWPMCGPAPQLEAPAAFWRRLFRLAGYAVDGYPRPLPEAPVVLYRGALEQYARGWPWTPNRVLAEAGRIQNGGGQAVADGGPSSGHVGGDDVQHVYSRGGLRSRCARRDSMCRRARGRRGDEISPAAHGGHGRLSPEAAASYRRPHHGPLSGPTMARRPGSTGQRSPLARWSALADPGAPCRAAGQHHSPALRRTRGRGRSRPPGRGRAGRGRRPGPGGAGPPGQAAQHPRRRPAAAA